ncbi:MAG: tetratricopeptide repeat protein [Deltaproteobacteria bacterium]|nr:tetratricopeptide repeat protein [Deltaproteobacteria bacterium]
MLPRLRKFPLPSASSTGCLVAALALAIALLLGSGTARAESLDDGSAPSVFGPTEGVPDEWIVALNDYVADPAKGGSRLIALTRQSDIELPPMVQLVVADAYLRTGNRRAAQREFEAVLARNAGYPRDDFGNLGMGTVRLMAGDTRGAEEYYGRLEGAGEASSRVLGNLGKGSALAAAGRYDEARAAFDKASSWESVDAEFRQAGRFGSASAQFAAGDYEGALKAFEELAASDPDGPIGRDARFAAARARLALGKFDEGAAGLRKITEDCDDERRTRRPSRALRDLDARAMGRTWVRNYRTRSWTGLFGKGNNMMSIDGCALARATLPAAEREDRRLMGVQRVSTAAATQPEAGRAASPEAGREPAAPAPTPTSGSSWLPLVVGAILAAAVVALLWRRSGNRA